MTRLFLVCLLAVRLPSLVVVPPLSGLLPCDERVDLLDCLLLVQAGVGATLEQGVDVERAVLGSMTQELKDTFYPSHELREQTVVVHVNLVDKLVEVVLMAGTRVDKSLHRLVRVCRSILFAAVVHNLKVVS